VNRPDRIEFALPAGPATPAAARRRLAQLGDRLDARTRADLELVIGELVSNSVRHGPGGEIAVRLNVSAPGVVRGEVEDGGDGVVEVREAAKDMRERASGGQGLRIVEALTTRWGVYPGSTHVWFELGGAPE
jgi:two-component sensor histidine kinase